MCFVYGVVKDGGGNVCGNGVGVEVGYLVVEFCF